MNDDNPQVNPAVVVSTEKTLKSDVNDLAQSADQLSARVEGLAVLLARKAEEDAVQTRFRRTGRAILGAYGIWVVDILLIIWIAVTGFHIDAVSECQAQQNNAFRDASAAGREARDRQDEQQLRQLDQQLALFSALANPGLTPNDRAAAGAQYVNSVADLKTAILAAKQKRADNPLPTGNCS